jgi:hypothetical protein
MAGNVRVWGYPDLASLNDQRVKCRPGSGIQQFFTNQIKILGEFERLLQRWLLRCLFQMQKR